MQVMSQDTPNPWKEVLIEALVVSHIYRPEHEDDPTTALRELLGWETFVALDPQVSSDAQKLIDQGRLQSTVAGQEAQAFARALFQENDWPHGGDIDGYDFQDLAVKHGLLLPVEVYAPCGENCNCLSYHGSAEEMSEGVTCYRKVGWLQAPEVKE